MVRRPLIALLVLDLRSPLATSDSARSIRPLSLSTCWRARFVRFGWRLKASRASISTCVTVRLTEPPEQAWIKLVGHDVIEVWVNGRRAGYTPPVGFKRTTGVVMDISPLYAWGENSIAIHVAQLVLDRPPWCRWKANAGSPTAPRSRSAIRRTGRRRTSTNGRSLLVRNGV